MFKKYLQKLENIRFMVKGRCNDQKQLKMNTDEIFKSKLNLFACVYTHGEKKSVIMLFISFSI